MSGRPRVFYILAIELLQMGKIVTFKVLKFLFVIIYGILLDF